MKKNKVLKIVLIVLGALVALLAAAVLGVLFYLHSMAAGIPETLPDAPADSTQVTLTDDEIDKLLSGEITLEELADEAAASGSGEQEASASAPQQETGAVSSPAGSSASSNPDKQVINIAGDGCFRMNMNEIATAAREKLPLIEVIVNNHVLGMVRQWQDLFYEKRYSATVLDDGVDFVKLAEAMGAKGYRVTSQEEFKEAFKEALESEVPVLIDCIINCDDKVWPMVAPGEAISSSFTGEDLAKKQ